MFHFFKIIYNKLILDLKFLNFFFLKLFVFVYNYVKSFFYLNSKNNFVYLDDYKEYKFKKYFYNIIFNYNLNDFNWYVFSKNYKNNFDFNYLFRFYFRISRTNNGFYFNFKKFKKFNNFLNFLKNYNMSGYFYIFNSLKFWFLPLFLGIFLLYMTIVLKTIPFNKILFAWVGIIMFSYWLISGFVFFFKKYQFGKYTSVVQRFWRRTYILFWTLEGATFSVFLFLTINASQESFYMFDQISIFKTHLYSWKLFLLKLFPIVFLIIFSYLLLLSLKWNIFSKHSLWLFIITFFLTYIVWIEFYQFFHVLNFYSNVNWVYDLDDHSWSLELEPRRTRMVNHFVMLLFILKFWHIIFIYGFWLFFILRCLETKRIRYPLFSANFQNFIILYIFAWVFMYPWFKFFFRRFLDTPYYWFYINNRKLIFRIFFYDFKIIYYGLISYFNDKKLNFFNYNDFYYFKLSNINNNYEFFKKNYIKNKIIKII